MVWIALDVYAETDSLRHEIPRRDRPTSPTSGQSRRA